MTVYTLFLYIAVAAIVLLATLGVGHSKLKKHNVTHPVQWFVQYFVGSLLIFSGLVKAVDPLGTAYKMQDYFTQFEIQGLPFMDMMHDNALAFSLVMLVLELVLGLCLILGIGQKRTTRVNLLMMLFFTFLTGFNYLTGYTSKPDEIGILEFAKWGAFSDANIRITDCGCFGDFLKLQPIETFIKDIIFTLMSFYLLFNTNKLKEILPRNKNIGPINLRKIICLLLIAAASWFCLQNYKFDKPMVDFRPFAEGIDLRKAKEDCDADAPLTETVFTYRNKENSEEKLINSSEIANHAYLWEDTLADGNKKWEIDSELTQSKTIKEGCNSQIQYFMFPEILDDPKYSFLVLGGDLTKTDKEAFKKIGSIASAAEKDGFSTRAFYYYTKQNIDDFRHEVNGAYEFMTADDKLIKTIIRANPGLLLLKDGKVIKKWHHKHIPEYLNVKKDFMQ
jgi:uncharacterized membrane protein YphA (DoxX/SURF4 family)